LVICERLLVVILNHDYGFSTEVAIAVSHKEGSGLLKAGERTVAMYVQRIGF